MSEFEKALKAYYDSADVRPLQVWLRAHPDGRLKPEEYEELARLMEYLPRGK